MSFYSIKILSITFSSSFNDCNVFKIKARIYTELPVTSILDGYALPYNILHIKGSFIDTSCFI